MFTRDHATGPVAQGSYGRRAAVTLPPGHGDVGHVDMGRLCLQEQDILCCLQCQAGFCTEGVAPRPLVGVMGHYAVPQHAYCDACTALFAWKLSDEEEIVTGRLSAQEAEG